MKTSAEKPTKPERKSKKPAKPSIDKAEVELSAEDLKEVTGGIKLIHEDNPG
jgi:hypothetical protein